MPIFTYFHEDKAHIRRLDTVTFRPRNPVWVSMVGIDVGVEIIPYREGK